MNIDKLLHIIKSSSSKEEGPSRAVDAAGLGAVGAGLGAAVGAGVQDRRNLSRHQTEYIPATGRVYKRRTGGGLGQPLAVTFPARSDYEAWTAKPRGSVRRAAGVGAAAGGIAGVLGSLSAHRPPTPVEQGR